MQGCHTIICGDRADIRGLVTDVTENYEVFVLETTIYSSPSSLSRSLITRQCPPACSTLARQESSRSMYWRGSKLSERSLVTFSATTSNPLKSRGRLSRT